MIPAILLIISIAAASINSTLLHKAAGKMDTVSFNMVGSVVWIVVLTILNGFSITVTAQTVLWGVLYGIIQILFMLFKAKAMGSGPVSATTLIGNCSLLLSTAVGVIVWQEKVSVPQIIGIALLIAALFCCTYTREQEKRSRIWRAYCCGFFVFSAGVGIVFKAFSMTGSGSVNDMMLVAAVTMVILSGLVRLCRAAPGKSEKRNSKGVLLLAFISGLLSCMYSRLNIFLTGALPSAVFFPGYNGGVILLATALGTYVLKERLSRWQIMGILLGTIAIVIIGLLG